MPQATRFTLNSAKDSANRSNPLRLVPGAGLALAEPAAASSAAAPTTRLSQGLRVVMVSSRPA